MAILVLREFGCRFKLAFAAQRAATEPKKQDRFAARADVTYPRVRRLALTYSKWGFPS